MSERRHVAHVFEAVQCYVVVVVIVFVSFPLVEEERLLDDPELHRGEAYCRWGGNSS